MKKRPKAESSHKKISKPKVSHAKRYIIESVIALLVVVVSILASLYFKQTRPWQAVASCSDYGGTYDTFGADSASHLAKQSRGIIVARATNADEYNSASRASIPSEQTLEVAVTQVLKGGPVLHIGQKIVLCPYAIGSQEVSGATPLLIFLDGRDGKYWVTEQGYVGVAAQDADHRYNLMVQSGPDSVSSADIVQLLHRK
jgi:hypothetical protein